MPIYRPLPDDTPDPVSVYFNFVIEGPGQWVVHQRLLLVRLLLLALAPVLALVYLEWIAINVLICMAWRTWRGVFLPPSKHTYGDMAWRQELSFVTNWLAPFKAVWGWLVGKHRA